MDRCPNCRARILGADHCRRCGMALDLLQKIEAAAEVQLALALHHLTNGDNAAASVAVRRALSLRRGPLAEELSAFAKSSQSRPEHGPGDTRQDPPNDSLGPLPNGFYGTGW